MITCPSCSAQMPDGTKFCTNCGTKLSVVNTCPNCGAELLPNATFCISCGVRVKSKEISTPPNSQPKPRNNTAIIIAVSFAVVIAMIIGIDVWTCSNREETKRGGYYNNGQEPGGTGQQIEGGVEEQDYSTPDRILYEVKGNVKCIITTLVYSYPPEDVESQMDNQDNTRIYEIQFTPSGLLSRYNCSSGDREIISRYDVSYSSDNMNMTIKSYDETNRSIKRDSQGRIVKISEEDQDEYVGAACEYTYEWDQEGRLISKKYDSWGVDCFGSIERYTCDDRGRISRIDKKVEFWDVEDQTTIIEYLKEDQFGNWTKRICNVQKNSHEIDDYGNVQDRESHYTYQETRTITYF